MFDPIVFSQRVKSLRLKNGLTQEALGKELDFSKQAINGFESGYRTTTIEKIAKIADYFNVSIDYLVGHTDDPHRH